MTYCYRNLIVVFALSACIAGCGFKSDLFIPGEPKKAGQLNSESIEALKQNALDNLSAEEIQVMEDKIEDVTREQVGDPGVPVAIDPLTDEEIEAIKKNRENNW